MKRKNREYEKMKSQIHISGNIEEEKEETTPDPKKGVKVSKDKKGALKKQHKSSKGSSGLKQSADKKASRASKYEVRV